MVAVPTVRGKSKADATSALQAGGFQVATKSIVSSGIAFGLAFGTDPAAGTMVGEGVDDLLARELTSTVKPGEERLRPTRGRG